MKDLLLYAADADVMAFMRSVLDKPSALDIRSLSFDIERHPQRDAGMVQSGAELVRMKKGRYGNALLIHDTQLFPHHLDPQRRYDLSQPLAAIQRHPQNPDLWGLKSLSPDKWVMTATDGAVRDVESGRSVSLMNGVRIHFGLVEGEIRV